MNFFLILISVILFLAVLFFSALATYVVHPKRHTLESCRAEEERHGVFGDFDSLVSAPYLIQSHDGYELHAEFFAAPEPSDKYVIITHGYTATRYASVKYLHLFRRLNYNCIIYDDRGHGENVRTKCTLGLHEAEDLMAVIADTYDRYGKDIYLGLHGESMGSALQITALKYHPNVKFIVNDCGFADLMGVLRHKVKLNFGLPEWVIYPASVMSRILYGYAFSAVRPIDSLADNRNVPICFVHGADDNFITPDHSQRMHKVTKAYTELHLFPGADHAQCLQTDPERYFRMVSDFLTKVEE
ncbi:MAG: alpha/beta hydrolase [Lachnospiraceae bacterium]|nr:alpha/beta hydrolase [Lachnospiraceae bacterium]